LHHAICKSFLEAGIDVICDKPLTTTLVEARDLMATLQHTGRLLGVTYTYTGYPMVREAGALIDARLAIQPDRQRKQAGGLRTDPAQAGASFIVGDLGTHC
jgi:predicted dehydrogenase